MARTTRPDAPERLALTRDKADGAATSRRARAIAGRRRADAGGARQVGGHDRHAAQQVLPRVLPAPVSGALPLRALLGRDVTKHERQVNTPAAGVTSAVRVPRARLQHGTAAGPADHHGPAHRRPWAAADGARVRGQQGQDHAAGAAVVHGRPPAARGDRRRRRRASGPRDAATGSSPTSASTPGPGAPCAASTSTSPWPNAQSPAASR
jgi:hypothetical protein